ncbi:MAG: ribbon-helix-helix protein, CopG family [bacterium]
MTKKGFDLAGMIDTAATPKETGIPQRGARLRQVKAERRSDQMSVRMTPSTRALIESLAEAEGVPSAEIVERAIATYAKHA